MSKQNRFRLREPFASGSHLSGAIAGLVGAVYLIHCGSGSCASVVVALAYILPLIILFLASGLFHGLHCSEETLTKLERFDYAAIYLFIAGTYTPVCLYVIGGSLGLGILVGEWFLACVAIWISITRGPAHRNLQVIIFLAMGWALVLALPTLSRSLPPMPFNLMILGGVFYSVGAVIFALNWPNLSKVRLSAHDFWHVLVLLGSGAHYAFIVQIMS